MYWIRQHNYIFFLLVAFFVVFYGPSYADSSSEELAAGRQYFEERFIKDKVVRGNYTQTQVLNEPPQLHEFQGLFVYWRDKGVHWRYTEPVFSGVTYMSKRVIAWDQDGSIRDLNAYSYVPKEQINFHSIFGSLVGGDIEDIERRFPFKWHKKNSLWFAEIFLYRAYDIEKIEITGDRYVHSIKLVGINGDVTTTEFERVSTESGLTISECRLYFPGPDCNDLSP